MTFWVFSYGLEQRGEKGDGDFRPGDGGGYVAPKKADYSHLLSRGDSDLQMLLFETFGGWSVPVVRLFNKMRDKVRDKLSKKQYDDEVSWTTRTWSSLMAQRMLVALHMAAAWEIARELSLAGAEDRPAEGRARDIYIFLPCRRAFRLRARGTRRAGLFLLSG